MLIPYAEFLKALTEKREADAAADALEMTLWRLSKGIRTAEMAMRRHPAGVELRLAIDGELFWSRAYSACQLEDLNIDGAAQHNAFVAKGWAPVEPDAS